MKSIVEAYKAYPLTADNRYNNELNAKRVGFQQGYEKAIKDIKNAVIELREKYRSNPDGQIGKPIEKRIYMLGKSNAICDVLDLLEDFIK